MLPRVAQICPICAGTSLASLTALDLAYLRCDGCGSLSLPPSSSPPSQVGSDPPSVERAKEAVYRSGLEWLETLSPPDRILDVGAGNGGFLAAALARGWTPSGVEPDASAAERARSLGLQVVTGDLSDLSGAGAPFAAITLWDSLDMLPDPLQGLVKVRELLRAGGLVLVRVRNPEVHLLMRRWLGGLSARVPSLAPTFHRFGISARGLRVLFGRAGLAAVEVRNSAMTEGDPYSKDIGFRQLAVASVKASASAAAWIAAAASGGRCLLGTSLIAVARRPAA